MQIPARRLKDGNQWQREEHEGEEKGIEGPQSPIRFIQHCRRKNRTSAIEHFEARLLSSCRREGLEARDGGALLTLLGVRFAVVQGVLLVHFFCFALLDFF